MAEKQLARFPDPLEFEVPAELEGWEEMYPSHYLFSQDRANWEQKQFWYQDKIHGPEAIPPLDLIFHEAWQMSLAQYTTRVFCIPPAQGIAHRMVGCYLYITAVDPPPPEIIKEKSELFAKRAFYIFENYDELWDKWLAKFKVLGQEMKDVKIPAELPKYVAEEQVIPAPRGYYATYDLIEIFNSLVNQMYKGWQYHFEMLNLTYLAYLMFADVARKLFPGLSESAIAKMVSGADVSMFRPEAELCRLSRLAVSLPGVSETLKKEGPAAPKIEELKKTVEGRKWLDELEKVKDPWFYISCGSGWFYYEGSWLTKLDIPFTYMKSYVERLGKGEKIERSLDEISETREKMVVEYRKLIKSEEDKKSFENAYKTVRAIYQFAEDHLFWVEHWLHTIWWEKIRGIGQIFVQRGLLKEVDDIFMFNRFEVPQMIEEVVTGWALGEGVPLRGKLYMGKAAKRHKILEAARKWSPVPALGIPPEVVAEPFTVMLWGITTEKVAEWLKGAAVVPESVTEIKGCASSAGVAEGKARVLKLLEEIVTLKDGEIMVCPNCNPAWAPVFTKIKAAVTDIGGLTSHGSITCREYRLPAVSGTGVATSIIKTGDFIRVDGDTGVVTILKRAD
jgi:pyruvate,water dikinase